MTTRRELVIAASGTLAGLLESDLAAKLGPEEAKRLAWAPEMCSDRTTVRVKDDEPEAADGEAAPRRGR